MSKYEWRRFAFYMFTGAVILGPYLYQYYN